MRGHATQFIPANFLCRATEKRAEFVEAQGSNALALHENERHELVVVGVEGGGFVGEEMGGVEFRLHELERAGVKSRFLVASLL